MGSLDRFVHAALELPNDDLMCQAFQLYMRELMPTFVSRPWPGMALLLAASHTPGRDAGNISGDSKAKLYWNVWRIQDYNALPFLEESLATNPISINLDALVTSQTSSLAQALPYSPAGNATVPNGLHFYLKVTFTVGTNPQALADFNAFMTQCVNDPASPMAAQYGWTSFLHGSYSQSGKLRRYINVWGTSRNLPDASGAIAWLTSQSAVRNVLDPAGPDNPQWMMLEPVNYT